jgi:hypothetical protein
MSAAFIPSSFPDLDGLLANSQLPLAGEFATSVAAPVAVITRPDDELIGLDVHNSYVPADGIKFLQGWVVDNWADYGIPSYWQRRTYIAPLGDILTNASLTVSGLVNVDGTIRGPTAESIMVGIAPDVGGPGIQMIGNGVTGYRHIELINTAGERKLIFGDLLGDIRWSTALLADPFGVDGQPLWDVRLYPPFAGALLCEGNFYANRMTINGTNASGLAFAILNTVGANAVTVDPSGEVTLQKGNLIFALADGSGALQFSGDGTTHGYRWYRPAHDSSLYLQDITTGLILVTISGAADPATSIVTFGSRLSCGELTSGSTYVTGSLSVLGTSAGLTLYSRSGSGTNPAWTIYGPDASSLSWYSNAVGGDKMALTGAGTLSVVQAFVAGTMADADIPNKGIAWSSDTPNTLKCRTPAGVLKTFTLT